MRKAALLATVVLCTAGCEVNINGKHAGPIEHLTKSIENGKYETARLELKMGAGELDVTGGSSKLLDGDFSYNIDTWKPVFISHEVAGSHADIKVEQPESGPAMGNIEYKWNLVLNDQVPWDIVTHLGAGEARIDLGNTALRKLTVHMGVGSLRMDLRGKPKHSFDVEIHGGVGEANVYLPKSAAIYATAHGGIGEISVDGLEKHGGRWTNPSGLDSPVSIRLEANGGIGSIRISAE
jgi:hypothetical protein